MYIHLHEQYAVLKSGELKAEALPLFPWTHWPLGILRRRLHPHAGCPDVKESIPPRDMSENSVGALFKQPMRPPQGPRCTPNLQL